MSDTRQARVEEIFLTAVELRPGDKTRFIQKSCGDDVELRREVESLLGYHQEIEVDGGGSFLDSKAAPGRGLLTQLGATSLKGDEPLLPADRRLGNYTVQAVLGQGGMGVVYVAEQERPKRTVALKVMRRGVGSEKLVRRFEFEADLLGKLQHPGIAQVYEAGAFRDPQTGTQHPFIAMELVRGRSLVQHVMEKGLATRERVELLARVCDAVQHAHMCGVIHRDLKPANVMVGEDGQPKILDFGVARAVDRDIAMTTIQTSVGQIIGTLPYMSPEQIGGQAHEVDTRSDVYALGVVLYEVLTGRLPYTFQGHSLPEAARLIRDQPPTRLSTIDRTLRGDIDTIVGKALAKERERRYQSAADFGADLRAYLEGRPIAARQDSALYVLRKQLNRYKGVVAAAIIFVMGVLAFAIYATHKAGESTELARLETAARRKAELARDDANKAQERADEAAAAVRRQLSFSNIERGRLLGLSGNTAAAEELLWPEHLKNLNSHQTFYALWELYANGRCEATLEANAPAVRRLKISPDGKMLATSGLEPGLLVWNTETFERLSQIPGKSKEHYGLAFSPLPGGVLALGGNDGRIALVDARSGVETLCLREVGAAVQELAFDRTGTRLIACTADGVVTLFDVADGATGDRTTTQRPIAGGTTPGKAAQCQSVAPHPTADTFALGCSDGKLRIVSSNDLRLLREVENPDDARPRVAYSPDARLLACGGMNRFTRLIDTETWEVVGTLSAPNGYIDGVQFTADGKQLMTVGWWYVHVWDVSERKVVQSFSVRAGGGQLAIAPDDRHVWASMHNEVRAWELDPEAGRMRINVPPNSRTLVCFAPTGELLAGDADGSITLLDGMTGEPIKVLGKGTRRVRAITMSPTAPIAATMGVDGVLYLWDLVNREKLAQWPGFKMITNDGMRFNSKGDALVLSAADDTFKVVEIPSGKIRLTIPTDNWEALAAAFSPDDQLIATTTRAEVLTLYDATTGEKVRTCEKPSGCPWTIAFTADGKKVVSGNWDRSLVVWDVATGAIERRLEGHRGLVTDLVFRPREPNVLSSAGADGRIMLWDLNLPQNTPILTLDGLDGWEVWSLDFDTKTPRLIGTNTLGDSVVWNVRHFNRHIGGNMRSQITRHRAELGDAFDEARAAEQEALLLSRGKKPAKGTEPPGQ